MPNKNREANADRRARAKRKWINSAPDSKSRSPYDRIIDGGLLWHQHMAVSALVSTHTDKCDLTAHLKTAFSQHGASYEFMLELYPHVLESPHDGDVNRLAVCTRLIGDKAVSRLLSMATNQNQSVSQAALSVLRQLEAGGARVIPDLQNILRDGPEHCRDSAYHTILNLLAHSGDVDRAAWLMDEQFAVRLLDDARTRDVTTVFLTFGTSGIDQLVRQLQGKHLRRRRTAATILGLMGDAARAAIPALKQATIHNDEVFRHKVWIALERIHKSL